MSKPVLAFIAAVSTSISIGHAADVTPPAAATPDTPQKAATVDAVMGLIKGRTESGERAGDSCQLQSPTTLPGYAMVVVVRRSPCVSRYGASLNKDYMEVLYAGKSRLVPVEAVLLSSEQSNRLAALEPAQIAASTENWILTSLLARKTELEKAKNALNATSKHGIAVLRARIFDVSEYTEGTGFTATVYNSTPRTIKYVTFAVVGLNAVGDPVRSGLLRRDAAAVLRGIGPIAPGETASYSKDYMWMTDVVESFRIASIKLEYMDGSNKLVSDTKSVRIQAQDYEALTVGGD